MICAVWMVNQAAGEEVKYPEPIMPLTGKELVGEWSSTIVLFFDDDKQLDWIFLRNQKGGVRVDPKKRNKKDKHGEMGEFLWQVSKKGNLFIRFTPGSELERQVPFPVLLSPIHVSEDKIRFQYYSMKRRGKEPEARHRVTFTRKQRQ